MEHVTHAEYAGKQEDNKVWRGRQDKGEEMAIHFDEVSSLYKWCNSRHTYIMFIFQLARGGLLP
jgi:antibiotic biosynthesis monooxygenase (ABM) superfamily enzyme